MKEVYEHNHHWDYKDSLSLFGWFFLIETHSMSETMQMYIMLSLQQPGCLFSKISSFPFCKLLILRYRYIPCHNVKTMIAAKTVVILDWLKNKKGNSRWVNRLSNPSWILGDRIFALWMQLFKYVCHSILVIRIFGILRNLRILLLVDWFPIKAVLFVNHS